MKKLVWGLYVLLVVPIFIALIELSVGKNTATRALFVNLALWIPISIASVVAHELGHAFVGKWMGLDVRRVVIGSGRELFRRTVRGIVVVWNRVPAGGLTLFATKTTHHRARLWLATLAGPLVSGALAFMCWGPQVPFVSVVSVQQVAFLVNIVLFATNVLPFPTRMGGTDGLRLLTIPFWQREQLQTFEQSSIIIDVLEALESHDSRRAQVAFESLGASRESPAFFGLHAALALEQGDYALARQKFTAMLALEKKPRAVLMLRNNLAWIAFRERDPARLEESDAISREVLADSGEEPWAFSTRGAVLLWKGELEAACDLLERAFNDLDAEVSRAYVASCLAMAWARRGHASNANSWLNAARGADSKCNLIPEATAVVAAEKNTVFRG